MAAEDKVAGFGGCLVILVLAVIGIIGFMGGCGKGYSEGERAGVVTKLSNKGLIWKSWEGQLNMGGLTRDNKGQPNANVWDFSIQDDAVAAKIQEAMRKGQPISIQYSQYLIKPIQISTDYVAVGVK